jgi:predicted DNA-binding transcriptional regulator YafY
VARLLSYKGALFRRGIQAELAREPNVSRSTICRDIAYLLRLGWPCPT